MGNYTPPFHITDRIATLALEIGEEVGRISVLSHGKLNPHLRRENRIRTIHFSLAIEHNSLSLEQVTAILNGKRILGNPNEIREVQNAYEAYDMMLSLDPYSIQDLLKAHKQMMQGLIPENGKFRSGGVGIFAGETLVHMAPPAYLVQSQIQDLFDWYKISTIHPLIKSAIFHYEFEFIHPFSDGNGRMGRMWHSLLLGSWKELFFWLPIEELIRSRQQEYYDVLGKSDQHADSSEFVQFMLEVIWETLKQTSVVGGEVKKNKGNICSEPVSRLLAVLGEETLSAVQIMERLSLSHKPTFRKNYLIPALNDGLIKMTVPDKPNSRNQKYYRA